MKLTEKEVENLLDELVDEETERHYGAAGLAREIAAIEMGLSDGDVVELDSDGFLVLLTSPEKITANVEKARNKRQSGEPLYRLIEAGAFSV